jgi:hypothetical protein
LAGTLAALSPALHPARNTNPPINNIALVLNSSSLNPYDAQEYHFAGTGSVTAITSICRPPFSFQPGSSSETRATPLRPSCV